MRFDLEGDPPCFWPETWDVGDESVISSSRILYGLLSLGAVVGWDASLSVVAFSSWSRQAVVWLSRVVSCG